VWVADNKELIANFSNSKSGWPWVSVYFLRDWPNFPVNCSIYFFGSDSSSASTPASNGVSSNGLLSFGISGVSDGSSPKSVGGVSKTGSDGVSGAAGSEEPNFNLNLFSSVTLSYRLFFLPFLLKGYLW